MVNVWKGLSAQASTGAYSNIRTPTPLNFVLEFESCFDAPDEIKYGLVFQSLSVQANPEIPDFWRGTLRCHPRTRHRTAVPCATSSPAPRQRCEALWTSAHTAAAMSARTLDIKCMYTGQNASCFPPVALNGARCTVRSTCSARVWICVS